MKQIRKSMLLIVAIVASALMISCGAADDPHAGMYRAVLLQGYTNEEYQEATGTTFDNMFWFELKAGGKGTIMIDGNTGDIQWELEEDTITIKDDSETMTGTLKDDTLTIEVEGIEVVFEKQEEEGDSEQTKEAS